MRDFDLSFSVAQEVGEEAWRLAEPPADCSNKWLFQTEDPDDPGVSIGMLIEQDERTGGLRGSTWFKTFNTGRFLASFDSAGIHRWSKAFAGDWFDASFLKIATDACAHTRPCGEHFVDATI
jgi:hypothetical protein